MNLRHGFVLIALLAVAPVCCLGPDGPASFAKPDPLPSPAVKVLRVANAEEILAAGEQMTVGSTMMVEPVAQILSARAESPKANSPGQSEYASDALGKMIQQIIQAL